VKKIYKWCEEVRYICCVEHNLLIIEEKIVYNYYKNQYIKNILNKLKIYKRH